MLHRMRALLIRQQTMLANAFRAHLAEFGIVVAQGIRNVRSEPIAWRPAQDHQIRQGVVQKLLERA